MGTSATERVRVGCPCRLSRYGLVRLRAGVLVANDGPSPFAGADARDASASASIGAESVGASGGDPDMRAKISCSGA